MNNQPLLLGFQLDGDQTVTARLLSVKQGFRFAAVPVEEYDRTIAMLAGDEEPAGNGEACEALPEPRLVFVRFSDAQVQTFLAACRAGKMSRPELLALQTETNSTWTPTQLAAQLSSEREMIRSRMKKIHEDGHPHTHHHGH